MNEETINELKAELEALKRSNPLWGKKWFATGASFTQGDFSNSAEQNFIFEDGKYAGKKRRTVREHTSL